MKHLLEALRGAKRIEILVITVIVCILMVLWFGAQDNNGYENEEEARMSRLLSNIEGAGRVHVMISTNSEGENTGVVVVSPGAKNMHVLLELQRTVRTLTGLDLDRIEILQSKR